MIKPLKPALITILLILAGCAANEGALKTPMAPVAPPAQVTLVPLQPTLAPEGAAAPTPQLVAATPVSATAQPIAAQAIVTPAPVLEHPSEPLVPTVPAAPQQPAAPSTTRLRATLPSTPTPTAPVVTMTPPPPLTPASERARLGVGWPPDVPYDPAVVRELGFGWYLDWSMRTEPLRMDGLEYAQMIRVHDDAPFWKQRDRIAQAVAANPGALWLIGNEPDVPWQDNVAPEDYARRYHQFYLYIKSLDPTARVAIGGVSQPTPLRLAYLERILAAYRRLYNQPMPIDVWNIHAFVLREERGSWGVSIPPGFDGVDQGMLYEVEDNDDLTIFQQQIIDFRRWMARQGYRSWPLIVTEYGVLMPEEYGFPPETVISFMESSFDFLLEARDPEIGYPADDNRLVQRFTWFSVGYSLYPTGNLVDPATGKLTAVGHAFADYAARLDGVWPQ